MDAYGVHVFHTAHDYRVSVGVAHGLKLYFLPAENIFFDENLPYRRGIESRFGGDFHFLVGICDSSASAAERKRGTDNYGITDFICDFYGVFDVFCGVRRYRRHSDFLHGVLEKLSVFRLIYTVDVCADEFYAVFFKEARLVELHCERKPRLSAEGCEHGIGFFLLYNSLYRLESQWFKIYFVGHLAVGHYRCGIRVYENDFHALLL